MDGLALDIYVPHIYRYASSICSKSLSWRRDPSHDSKSPELLAESVLKADDAAWTSIDVVGRLSVQEEASRQAVMRAANRWLVYDLAQRE
jgi:hypothetical protein